jgi:phosphate uptake regulator
VNPSASRQCIDALIIARNLERVADHATNIAEDVIFWTVGDDVRHGKHAAGNFVRLIVTVFRFRHLLRPHGRPKF